MYRYEKQLCFIQGSLDITLRKCRETTSWKINLHKIPDQFIISNRILRTRIFCTPEKYLEVSMEGKPFLYWKVYSVKRCYLEGDLINTRQTTLWLNLRYLLWIGSWASRVKDVLFGPCCKVVQQENPFTRL